MGWAYNQGKAGLSIKGPEALDIGTLALHGLSANIKGKREAPIIRGT